MALGFLKRGAYTDTHAYETKMPRNFNIDFGDMALALVLWMCSLPLVALLVVPVFGLKIGVIIAVVLFIVVMSICRGVCSWKIYKVGL